MSCPTSPITINSDTVEPVDRKTKSYRAQGKWELLVHLVCLKPPISQRTPGFAGSDFAQIDICVLAGLVQ